MHSQHYAQWIDNTSSVTLIFISGWGIDHRIFPTHDTHYNYLTLFPDIPNITHQIDLYRPLLKTHRIILVGFSMGAYIAQHIVKTQLLTPHYVIYIGARPAYLPSEITKIKRLLQRQKDAYMTAFYRSCFFSHEEWIQFKKEILPLTLVDQDTLHVQLSELSAYRLDTTPNLWIHGQQDMIAPIEDIQDHKDTLLQIENCGHCPFYHPQWNTLFRPC